MDYKKAYEEALERARDLHDNHPLGQPQTWMTCEKIFPELRESEDEKWRKWLIGHLKGYINQTDDKYAEVCKKAIAWLEKQGEPLCWIKCSDGLPNRDGTYLVVTDGSHNDVYDMAKYDSIGGWHKASEIIYWMPIPQLNNKSIIEQKSSWSEEDEANMDYSSEIIGFLKNYVKTYGYTAMNSWVKWLNSLKPQPRWKPSEEQLRAIINSAQGLYQCKEKEVLLDLYEQLKKL